MASELLTVEVVFALPNKQRIVEVQVASGTTAIEAVEQSGIAALFPEWDMPRCEMGVFGQKIPAQTYLVKEGDRIEIYRPLICDPKAMRAAKYDKVRSRKWRPNG